jgi:hypothetical protein
MWTTMLMLDAQMKGQNLISLLYVKLYELPISSGAIRCNEIERFPKALKRDKRFVESSR